MADTKLKIVKSDYYEPDEKLRAWLKQFVEEHPHLPTSVLARKDHIGFSRTALDAYIKGTYYLAKEDGGLYEKPPKNSKVEDAVRSYRDKVEGVIKNGYNTSFRETVMWKQFQFLCRTAIEEKVIVIGYGPPGVGKSRALRQYKTEKQQTMPIEIFCSANITPRYFVKKIAKELGLNTRPPIAEIEDLIAEKLKKGPTRLLVVDQANYLDEKGLGTICYIWEKAGIPIVLLGTTDLFNLFMTSDLTEDVRAQLTSRVAWHCPFVTLEISEVKSIVTKMLGPTKATTKIIEQIDAITGGNHRLLDMVLPRVLGIIEKNEPEIASGKWSVEELVAEAGRKLLIA